MKLSDVLKDWPEKKEFVASDVFKEVDSFKDGYNTALTSCDREIDREALAKELFLRNFPTGKWEEIYKSTNEHYLLLADQIISTMPKWLKPTERK